MLAEVVRRGLSLTPQGASDLPAFRFRAADYLTQKLNWTPWRGSHGQPGQQEIIDAYTLALRQQHERAVWEADPSAPLTCWTPGQTIQNYIRIEAGHTVGKTKLASGLVSHFFDCFTPSILYTFAPSWEQIHDLLWKEIKADRAGKGLPGRILDLELQVSPDHFAKGRATNNAGGQGTERAQGQHGKYLMFVLDEAEGIPDFVYDAVESMASGGIVIVLMLANPRTRTSRFHKIREQANVANFRLSCLYHPNVLAGREIVPGAVRRDYVEGMLAKHAEQVTHHDQDAQTFELPWRPGEVYAPDPEFMFRVLGVAPANVSEDTFVPSGRYTAALSRQAVRTGAEDIRMGVDVARWGNDAGTVYVRQGMQAWRAAKITKSDTVAYVSAIRAEALRLAVPIAFVGHPTQSLHIRVDAGGGFGGGVVDQIKNDPALKAAYRDFRVIEVDFGGTPQDEKAYYHMVTQMYAEAGETLKGLQLVHAPGELEADLTERRFGWANKSGVAVKQLEPKDEFRKPKRAGRSPDDGDGFVLAVAPDHLFPSQASQPMTQSNYRGQPKHAPARRPGLR